MSRAHYLVNVLAMMSFAPCFLFVFKFNTKCAPERDVVYECAVGQRCVSCRGNGRRGCVL